jgi:hypothetical protein
MISWLVCTRPIFGPLESRQPSPRNIELDWSTYKTMSVMINLKVYCRGTLVGLSRNPSLDNNRTLAVEPGRLPAL